MIPICGKRRRSFWLRKRHANSSRSSRQQRPGEAAGGRCAAGFRLTLPKTTEPLPRHLPLRKLPDEACVVDYLDGQIDLRDRGRLGSFTIAEHWQADKRLADEELVFKLLRRMRDDEDESVARTGPAIFADDWNRR